MKRFCLLALAFVALAVPTVVLAGGGDTAFDGIVHSIESRYHVHATQVPFMGLMSLVSKKASNGGVAGLHIAEFESFTGTVDGNELNSMVEQKLGSGWERMIRETSKSGHNQTLIFVHPDGARMALLVLDLDGNEMDVVQVSVDPKHIDGNIGQYRHHHRDADEDSTKDDGKDTESN
jgi:hypothetical protein